MHCFTGSEIITKPKVYVVVQYLLKRAAEMVRVIHAARLEDHGSREQLLKNALKSGEESLDEPIDGELSGI